MRKTLMLGVVTLLAALGAPAAASAHHLEQNTSTIDCVLVNNAPVLQIHAQYRGFAPGDLPVYVTVTVDHAVVPGGSYVLGTPATPVPLPDFADDKTFPLTPGVHEVVYDARWPGNYGGMGPRTVVCPPPVVTPPPPQLPPPPPATVTMCNGQQMPVGTPPVVCTTPPKRHPRCVPTKLRLKVVHRRLIHGEQAFVVKGVGWRHVKWVHWTVRRPGGSWHKVGTSGRPWEHIVNHGLKWRIYLWVESVWGYPQWGMHDVRAKVRVKGVCGTRTVAVKIRTMNHDPEPRAHAWQ